MQISYHKKSFIRPLQPPGSKSVTNRLLILKYLYFLKLNIGNASTSTDSQSLQKSLQNASNGFDTFYIEDGGTSLRFLLCYLAILNKPAFVSCGKTLYTRPHNELINTLNQIGFDIVKVSNGFKISKVDLNNLQTTWAVDVSKSSQFATALLLIAPALQQPIEISLHGNPVSKGYFELTVGLMQDLGFSVTKTDTTVSVAPFTPIDDSLVVMTEADWSSISYFIAISRLSDQPVTLLNVSEHSLQPDKSILTFAKAVGIDFEFLEGNLFLYPIQGFKYPKQLERDYTNCPDIALTEIVICHALGIKLKTKGTDHLKYKESNRLEIIHQEISKFSFPSPAFKSHNDHRIAMSLTCLSIIKPIQLDDISVVSKSFPDFWQEVSKLGIYLTPQNG